MHSEFDSIDAALLVWSDPADLRWGQAFPDALSHPEMAEAMLGAFQETLRALVSNPPVSIRSMVEPCIGPRIWAACSASCSMRSRRMAARMRRHRPELTARHTIALELRIHAHPRSRT
jgi:hypothetical protein